MNTKRIEKIPVPASSLQGFLNDYRGGYRREIINRINSSLNEICVTAGNILAAANQKDNGWVPMETFKGETVFYQDKVGAVFPDFASFKVGESNTYYPFNLEDFKRDFCGFKGGLISKKEFRQCFESRFDELKAKYKWNFQTNCFSLEGQTNGMTINVSGYGGPSWGGTSSSMASHIPVYRLQLEDNCTLPKIILKWFENEIVPRGFQPDLRKNFRMLREVFGWGDTAFRILENSLVVEKLPNNIENGSTDIFGLSIPTEAACRQMLEGGEMMLPERLKSVLVKRLLNCDKVRCDLEPYDEKLLSDPSRGHWDLWDIALTDVTHEGKCSTVYVKDDLMARDPADDIREDGIVGIDFGTKSTVVVYQENDEHTLPMRIGTGQLSKKAVETHYENPTVIELINLEKFLEAYRQKAGRPETCWEDITTSHTAYEDLLGCSSDYYYSFLSELKQWAGDSNRRIKLRDKNGAEENLPPFLEIDDEAFNPIEIYAYYIGLYINNMRNGIYLDYVMSFPVTYEKKVQEKILQSFERGIKKSLPESILNDAGIMEKLRIRSIGSEPTAYAISALQEYQLEPTLDKPIYYAVFDFGGGTTDFDYGLWRESDSRRYDYVLECLKSDGDPHLGGENLLELLAFELFRKNQEKLLENGITFFKPPECKRFPGSEMLLDDSQESHINLTQLMKVLRPFWENEAPASSDGFANPVFFPEGILKVDLFDRKGEQRIQFELAVDEEELYQILRNRIEIGVKNFFEGLRLSFEMPETSDIRATDIQANLFLAGNSSKSPIVRELFEEYADRERQRVNPNGTARLYEIYPPLGTPEAKAFMLEHNIDPDIAGGVRPTGKTGVAFGLIHGRPGSKIKINQKNLSDGGNEIPFQYYIGFERKRKFQCLSTKDLQYGEWIYFTDTDSDVDFTLFYSSIPQASTNQMKVTDAGIMRKKCRLKNLYPDAKIYYRAVGPETIEYVVSKKENPQEQDYLEPPVCLHLEKTRG